MRTKDLAAGVNRIKSDPVFDVLIEEIKQEQINVFMSAGSTAEAIENAHNMVVALELILSKFDAVLAADKLEDIRNSK